MLIRESRINGYITIYNQHANPSNARFCEICGKETLFFKKGILKSYQEYQHEKEAEEQVEAFLASQAQATSKQESEPFLPDFNNELPFN